MCVTIESVEMEYTVLDKMSITQFSLKLWKSGRPIWASLEDGEKIQTLTKPSKSFMIVGEISHIITLENELNQCVLELKEIRHDKTYGNTFFAHIHTNVQNLEPKVGDIVAFLNPFIVVRHGFKSRLRPVQYSVMCCKPLGNCEHIFYFKQRNSVPQSIKNSICTDDQHRKGKERLDNGASGKSPSNKSQQDSAKIHASCSRKEDIELIQSVSDGKESFRVVSIKPEMRDGDIMDWVCGSCVLGCGETFTSLHLNFEDMNQVVCPACLEKGVRLKLNLSLLVELFVINTKDEKCELLLHNEIAEHFFNCTVEEFISSKSLRKDKYKMVKCYCTSANPTKPLMLSCFVMKIGNGKLLCLG